MNYLVGLVVIVLGVTFVIAGAEGTGKQLFTGLSGKGLPNSGSTSTPPPGGTSSTPPGSTPGATIIPAGPQFSTMPTQPGLVGA